MPRAPRGNLNLDLLVVLKRKNRKKLDSGISYFSLPILSFFLSYLVIGGETGEIKGGKKTNLQSSKRLATGSSHPGSPSGPLRRRGRSRTRKS